MKEKKKQSHKLVIAICAGVATIAAALTFSSCQSPQHKLDKSGHGAVISDRNSGLIQSAGDNSPIQNIEVRDGQKVDLRNDHDKERAISSQILQGEEAHAKGATKRAYYIFQTALQDAEGIEYSNTTRKYYLGMAQAENGLGMSSSPQSPEEAIGHFERASDYAKRCGSWQIFALSTLNRGNLYKNLQQYSKARDLFIEGLDVLKPPFVTVEAGSLESKKVTATRGYFQMGLFEVAVQEHSRATNEESKANLLAQAKRHFDLGKAACDSVGEYGQLAARLQNYAVFLYLNQDYEGGIMQARKAEAMNRGPDGNIYNLATNLQLAAECATELNKWPVASQAVLESLVLFKATDRPDMVCMTLQTGSKVLIHHGLYYDAAVLLFAIQEIRKRPLSPSEGNDEVERLKLISIVKGKLSRQLREAAQRQAITLTWERAMYFAKAKIEAKTVVAMR